NWLENLTYDRKVVGSSPSRHAFSRPYESFAPGAGYRASLSIPQAPNVARTSTIDQVRCAQCARGQEAMCLLVGETHKGVLPSLPTRCCRPRYFWAILSLMMPMMAMRMAPPTPPPPTVARMLRRSKLPPPAAVPITIWRIVPPNPPPTIPAMEFPTAPRLFSFMAAPATFPPTAPLTASMIKLVITLGGHSFFFFFS